MHFHRLTCIYICLQCRHTHSHAHKYTACTHTHTVAKIPSQAKLALKSSFALAFGVIGILEERNADIGYQMQEKTQLHRNKDDQECVECNDLKKGERKNNNLCFAYLRLRGYSE